MQETKFGLQYRHWLKANPRYTSSIELKQTETDSIPFDCVTQEQLDFALAIQSDKGVLIRTTGVEGLPDYVYLRAEPAYVVIRYPKHFVIIGVETFLLEKKRSKPKSLTSERAKEISIVTVPNKKPR